MQGQNKQVYLIDNFTGMIAKAVSYLTFLLVLTLTYEVVSRYVFESPTQWSFDVTYFLSSLFLSLGMGYTWWSGGHVSVDLISSRLPKRLAAGIFVFFMVVLFFLCWGNITSAMITHVQNSWALKERAMTGFLPPIYPYKTWILISVILMLIQGVSQLIKQLYIMITGEELKGDGKYEC